MKKNLDKKTKKPKGPGGRLPASDVVKLRGKKLGAAIQKSRVEQNMKQEELAARASIKIDTLRSIERARISSPSIFTIADIAKALKVEDMSIWLK